ncbi:acetyltransferase (GNAT) family protein [Anaerotignum neopropionicum]|uniref:Acetyltransferase (GNAT) family protein n=1 Tax=Anaerotignum neopropionicum TaxID=36847 RepID=A0A136WEA5_9FIRM|nr:GNAT family N-acetyltransferase [Anaerotignum neopropionicum]KXL52858.1 acetyltransferase (GNAT) family protein [Anaerotignum neopropionicum]
MAEIELQLPTHQHKNGAEAFKQEFFRSNESIINGSALLDQMDYEDWLTHTIKNQSPETVNKEWVLATTFFAVRKADKKIVGMVDVRHNLEHDFLADFGGHIGFSVIPSERNKGYATKMLELGLDYAKTLNLEKVMVGCFSNNLPSIRTIQKCGGVLTETKPYSDGNLVNIYWILLQ